MPRKEKTASERASAQADLVKQYRAIGPAAVVAALICAKKAKHEKAAPVAKAA
jgi:hypothetical protein